MRASQTRRSTSPSTTRSRTEIMSRPNMCMFDGYEGRCFVVEQTLSAGTGRPSRPCYVSMIRADGVSYASCRPIQCTASQVSDLTITTGNKMHGTHSVIELMSVVWPAAHWHRALLLAMWCTRLPICEVTQGLVCVLSCLQNRANGGYSGRE